jgi:hypothetical protein
MQMLAMSLLVLCSMVSLVWVSRHVLLWRQRRLDDVLRPNSPPVAGNAPALSVVVAAKDEEDNIESCLRTMLQQDYPDFELIAVDDRSTDRTGEIIDAIAQEDDRLQAVHVTELPPGWGGKNNAMRAGIERARGNWLCMIDADCRQVCQGTLSAAMHYALRHRTDLLSVLPVLEMRTFWEHVAQPVCSGVMMIWFRPDRVNDPRHRAAYANGAFMLMRRDAYEQVGAHAAVRDKHNEDMHLAALVKGAGLSLRVVRSEGLYLTRMYTSLGAIVRGWTRIFHGTFGTPGRLATSMVVVLLVSMLPWLATAGTVSAVAAGAGGWWWAALGAAAASLALQVSALVPYYRILHARAGLVWTYPLGCVVALVSLVQAMGKTRRGAKLVWRGTQYTTGQRREPVSPAR